MSENASKNSSKSILQFENSHEADLWVNFVKMVIESPRTYTNDKKESLTIENCADDLLFTYRLRSQKLNSSGGYR